MSALCFGGLEQRVVEHHLFGGAVHGGVFGKLVAENRGEIGYVCVVEARFLLEGVEAERSLEIAVAEVAAERVGKHAAQRGVGNDEEYECGAACAIYGGGD